MDGIMLPPELEWIIQHMGIDWRDAKEIAMADRGGDWARFAFTATQLDLQAVSAVNTMLESNTSDGLTAFRQYFDTVAGMTGYMPRTILADGATAASLIQAAGLIGQHKLLIIENLVFMAGLAVDAAALAVETAGASVLAWFEILSDVDIELAAAEVALIAALAAVGGPLAKAVSRLLDVDIRRLQARQMHHGPDATTTYQSPDERAKTAQEDAARKAELDKDPDHNGQVDDGSMREAEVALALEKAGVFAPGSLSRPPVSGMGDFFEELPDGTTQRWDVKGFPSYDPQGNKPPNQCYNDESVTAAINKQLAKTPPRNVIMDMGLLNNADRRSLEALVHRHPEWQGKVKVY